MLLDFSQAKPSRAQVLSVFLTFLAAASSTALPDISPEVTAIVRQLQKESSPELIAQLEKLSAAKDDGASILLGEIYFAGRFGQSRDEDKACDYFEPLASKYGEAAHNLATCYFTGGGKRKDKAAARRIYRKAVDLQFPDSSCALGNMMITGQGGDKDVPGGLALCLRAAESGVAHAQADYGTYLLLGKVITKDAATARHWLELAANQKHGNASFLLGQIYWNGDGVTKDRVIAAKWLNVAYQNGRPDASYLLAQEAMTRLIVKQGEKSVIAPEVLTEAIHWLEITQKVNGPPEEQRKAQELLETLYLAQKRT